MAARRLAVEVLVRIEEGAHANAALPAELERSELEPRDRAFATSLVYGTVRMQRATDWLVGRYLLGELPDLDPDVRAGLRLGAYQLRFLGTPPHAAVSATVDAVGGRARGMINAVLRKVAAEDEPVWPSDGVRLSYPDWIIKRLRADLGDERAFAALEEMNRPGAATEREDGYVQDLASQWVAELVDVQPGDIVIDVCAAPGGKATAMAGAGALVLAGDLNPGRARMLDRNRQRLGFEHNSPEVADRGMRDPGVSDPGVSDSGASDPGASDPELTDPEVAEPVAGGQRQHGRLMAMVADGASPPVRRSSADRVLVDAPCTGLGALRRRPDARWRITEDAVGRLVDTQKRLLTAAAELVKPGGVLVYSVCTLSDAETVGVDEWTRVALKSFEPLDPPDGPWEPHGRGARLLPQSAGTDGMSILRLRRN